MTKGEELHVGSPEGLLTWQGRMGMTGVAAADALGLPYMTYREYLPGGRRRRGGAFPRWLGLLCHYIETHGVIQAPLFVE